MHETKRKEGWAGGRQKSSKLTRYKRMNVSGQTRSERVQNIHKRNLINHFVLKTLRT